MKHITQSNRHSPTEHTNHPDESTLLKRKIIRRSFIIIEAMALISMWALMLVVMPVLGIMMISCVAVLAVRGWRGVVRQWEYYD